MIAKHTNKPQALDTCPENCIEVGGYALNEPAILFFHQDDTTKVVGYRRPEDLDEKRRAALSSHLNCPLDEVEAFTYDEHRFEAESEEWLIFTDDEADKAAREDIIECLWAFRPEFLSDYMPDGVTSDIIQTMQAKLCEDAQPAFKAMLGGQVRIVVRDAMSADGRGHFLASYDGEEIEEMDLFMFRVD